MVTGLMRDNRFRLSGAIVPETARTQISFSIMKLHNGSQRLPLFSKIKRNARLATFHLTVNKVRCACFCFSFS